MRALLVSVVCVAWFLERATASRQQEALEEAMRDAEEFAATEIRVSLFMENRAP